MKPSSAFTPLDRFMVSTEDVYVGVEVTTIASKVAWSAISAMFSIRHLRIRTLIQTLLAHLAPILSPPPGYSRRLTLTTPSLFAPRPRR
jgi:hypothetical protein